MKKLSRNGHKFIVTKKEILEYSKMNNIGVVFMDGKQIYKEILDNAESITKLFEADPFTIK